MDIIINEFAIALKKNPRLTLKIAGHGSQEKKLKALVKKLGIEDKIFFLGWVNNINDLYDESVALIMASLVLESFGLVVLEAMTNARPSIVSNRGALPWTAKHCKKSMVFDALKKGDLADKIIQMTSDKTLIGEMKKKDFSKAIKDFEDRQRRFGK